MEYCPYCYNPLEDDDIVCWSCGHDVVDLPEEAFPDLIDSITTEKAAVLEYGMHLSRLALLAAILGFSGVGPCTVGIALSMARRARNYLEPDDRGYGNIILAEILAWIMAVVLIIYVVLTPLLFVISEINY